MSLSKKGKPSPHKGKKNQKITDFLTINLNDDIINDIVMSYINGEPSNKIAERLKYSRTLITRVLKENGVKMRTAGETKLMKRALTSK